MQIEFIKYFEVDTSHSLLTSFSLSIILMLISIISGTFLTIKIVNLFKEIKFKIRELRFFVFLFLGCPMLIFASWESYQNGCFIDSVLKKYKNGNFDKVEGIVKVKNTEPFYGHSSEESICISNKCFSFSYYSSNPFYHQTISHGGVLKDGALVLIYSIDNCILAVYIASNQ
jgi:hypothetical protein